MKPLRQTNFQINPRAQGRARWKDDKGTPFDFRMWLRMCQEHQKIKSPIRQGTNAKQGVES